MTNQNKKESTSLYLLALVPHQDLREKVYYLKKEMSERYDSSHALKIPAHITLQMPFRRPESEEDFLEKRVRLFAGKIDSFDVHLNGFDAFPPRVIYIDVANPAPIADLHAALQKVLIEDLNFTDKQLMNRFHPHMTIATRDLSKKMFHKAWPELKERDFQASFTADRLHLLKHNGKHWELYREFAFEGGKTEK